MPNVASYSTYPPGIQTLTDRLRRFILETVPEAEERVYKGGCSMGYHAPRRGCFCGLFLRREAVYLVFPTGGHLLPDPDGLLKDEGRYVELRPDAAFPEEALFRLIVAALLMHP